MRFVRTVGPVGCLAVALALGGLAPVGVDSAAAARPVRGALYADMTADYTYRAYLGVSNGGRSLDPRRSRIVDPYCQGEPSIVRMGSRRHPVRVTRSGRFQLVQRVGRYVLRVRGLFTTKNSARIRFRYRREPARARPRSCENDTGRVALRPARIRPIPFSDCATHDAKTVLGTPTGRVFWQPAWDRFEGWTKVAYACLFSANKRFKLHRDEDDDSDLDQIRLAGPYVAYAWHPCGGAACVTHVVQVLDLRDGRWLEADVGRPATCPISSSRRTAPLPSSRTPTPTPRLRSSGRATCSGLGGSTTATSRTPR
jgi:hypothetical protein